MTHDFVTTAFTLDGYRITQHNSGLWCAASSCAPALSFGTIGASLQTIVGGNITLLTRSVRENPRASLRENGKPRRNDGRRRHIIGMRYDATEVMQGVTEVLCYGTAVRLGSAN